MRVSRGGKVGAHGAVQNENRTRPVIHIGHRTCLSHTVDTYSKVHPHTEFLRTVTSAHTHLLVSARTVLARSHTHSFQRSLVGERLAQHLRHYIVLGPAEVGSLVVVELVAHQHMLQ